MTHKSAFRPLRNYFNDVTTIYDLCVLVWNQLAREALQNNLSFFLVISPKLVPPPHPPKKQALKIDFGSLGLGPPHPNV